MKIGLITFTASYFAFGMRSIENYLRSKGHDVFTIYAYTTSRNNRISLLNPYQLKNIADKCKHCDIIGISVISIHSLKKVKQAYRYLKETTNAFIVIGGVPVIVSPDLFIDFSEFICVGEGELFFDALLDSKDIHTIPGLGYKKKSGAFVYNRPERLVDVNQLPVPKIDFENTYYLSENKIEALSENPSILFYQCYRKGYRLMMSRGCPFNCSYCCNSTLNRVYRGLGRITRKTSVDRVISELEYAKEIIPELDKIYFLDDDLTVLNEDEFASLISEYGKKISLLIWEFSSTITSISKKKIDLLTKSNIPVDHIRIGLQSANLNTNKYVFNRKFNDTDYFDKIEMLLVESMEDLSENITFFIKLGKRIDKMRLPVELVKFNHFNLVYFPGTPLYDRALSAKIIDENYIDEELTKTDYSIIKNVRVHTFVAIIYRLLIRRNWRWVGFPLKKPVILQLIDHIFTKVHIINVLSRDIILYFRMKSG